MKDYLKPKPLNKKFLEGRHKPYFRAGSSMERAWYMEQVEYCINGRTVAGRYMNPLYYYFLNFTRFPVVTRDAQGRILSRGIGYADYTRIDEYIFDIMWQAKKYGWHVSLMGGRGIGKSYIFTSIITREYSLFPNSSSFVSATSKAIVDEAMSKVVKTLNEFEKKHPALKHKRLSNNATQIKSGEVVIDEMGETIQGYQSDITRVIYDKNPDVTRGSRPSVQLIEEFAAFPSERSKGSLKEVFTQSKGSWTIGGTDVTCFVMLSGTGGSVENDESKDLFLNPDAYNIYPINEWDGMSSGIFIPVTHKLSGNWEKKGVPDIEAARVIVDERRAKVRADTKLYQNEIQEYPLTIREVFTKKGKNRFNQDLIAEAWNNIELGQTPKVEKGFMKWQKNDDGAIIGVEFVPSNNGHVRILEHPEKGAKGGKYKDLYVNGVDSIDVGNADSTDAEGSDLSSLIKKRIVDGEFFNKTSNMYVAYYLNRSDEVRDDYDQVLMLSLYYNAKVNLEWTRIGIVEHFRKYGYYHLFMERPSIALTDKSGKKKNKMMGTPASKEVILHQDEKVAEYIRDNWDKLGFINLVEQLRDYNELDRRKFDLVISMGLCELADADYMGKGGKIADDYLSNEFQAIGYYTDENGVKQHGVIKKSTEDKMMDKLKLNAIEAPVRWVDENNVSRFDEDYYSETGGDTGEIEQVSIEDFRLF